MKIRRYLCSLVLSLSLFVANIPLAGCGARVKHVTNLPTGVTEKQVQDWDSAVANLHKIATVTSTLRKTVIGLNKQTYTIGVGGVPQKVFPDGPEYATALGAIAKVDQTQIAAANFLQTVPKTWPSSTQEKVREYMNTIAEELKKLNAVGATGIHNANSMQQVSQIIGELTSAVGLILSLTQPI
jgi:hypothetical protein